MQIKKGFKILAVTTTAVIAATALTSCSIPGMGSKTGSTSQQTSQSESQSVSSPKAPSEAIIGKWIVESVTDKSGKAVSLSDVDLTGTPVEGMSSMIGYVLKQGVTIEFKADNTVPLIITSANYEVNGNKLKLTFPDMNQEAEFDFTISGSTMNVKIGDYTLNLKK